jgi:nicotinamidase-related amidase
MRAALLMVDMSNEQVASLSSSEKNRIVRGIQQLTTQTKSDNAGIPKKWTIKIDSRLWLENDTESTLSRVYPEWGVTMGVPNTQGAALIPELEPCGPWQFVPKKHYSSFVDSTLLACLQQAQITHVYLVGINTDYCIFNTAMDSFARGRFETFVVEDGVGSISGKAGHQQGLTWIRAHLGAQAIVSLTDIQRRFEQEA